MKVQLRPYQADGVDRLRDAFRAGRRAVLYCLPTGGGKTVIFSTVAESAAARGKSVYILVHRQELLLQCSRHLAALGIPHGRVAPGHSITRDGVQVASVQTLVKRLEKYRAPDLIIADECHHATAGSWRKIIDRWPDALLLGVTATPTRLDGAGLGKHAGGVFDHLEVGPSISWLIENGYLSRPVVYAPSGDLDLSGLRVRGGDFEKGELEKRVDRPSITGCAVSHYRNLANGVPAIAFCCSVQHAQNVAEEFRAAGYRARCIDGTMADGDRKKAIEDLGAGRIDVLTSCEIVSEGTDIPVVGCAILLRPTMSEGLFLQQAGRALRLYPGKRETVILDHAGNCLRHGLPDDDREWTLDGERRRKRKKDDDEPEIMVRRCPVCFAVFKPAPACPKCGHVHEAKARKIDSVDGELKKITDAEKDLLKRQRRAKIGRARSLDELQQLAKELGYAQGWARFIWRARERKQSHQKNPFGVPR